MTVMKAVKKSSFNFGGAPFGVGFGNPRKG
jgi:hypothetical protein